MRWLIDGYNVIRRSPELSSREMVSLEEGRQALCELLSATAGAVVVTTDEFLARLGRRRRAPDVSDADAPDASLRDANLPDANLKDEEEAPRGPRKGNPRRLGKKARAARRALGRLGPGRLP